MAIQALSSSSSSNCNVAVNQDCSDDDRLCSRPQGEPEGETTHLDGLLAPNPNGYLRTELRIKRTWAHWKRFGQPKFTVAPWSTTPSSPSAVLPQEDHPQFVQLVNDPDFGGFQWEKRRKQGRFATEKSRAKREKLKPQLQTETEEKLQQTEGGIWKAGAVVPRKRRHRLPPHPVPVCQFSPRKRGKPLLPSNFNVPFKHKC